MIIYPIACRKWVISHSMYEVIENTLINKKLIRRFYTFNILKLYTGIKFWTWMCVLTYITLIDYLHSVAIMLLTVCFLGFCNWLGMYGAICCLPSNAIWRAKYRTHKTCLWSRSHLLWYCWYVRAIHKWSVSWKGRRGIWKKHIFKFIFKNIYIVLYWRMFFFVLLWFTKALKLLPREKIQLATKFGNVFENGELVVKGGRDYVRKACEDSLNRLNVDYIDLYYQHRVDTSVPIEETVCMHINGRKSDPFFSNRSI